MKHTVYMENGSICDMLGRIVEKPAIMFDKEDSVCHGWGDAKNIKAKYDKFVAAYNKMAMQELAADMVYLELNEYKMPREMQCFILRYASEHSGTTFLKELYNRLNDPGVFQWLENKMQKMNLDLTEKEFKTGR